MGIRQREETGKGVRQGWVRGLELKTVQKDETRG
jgi:hypothetical protein